MKDYISKQILSEASRRDSLKRELKKYDRAGSILFIIGGLVLAAAIALSVRMGQ